MSTSVLTAHAALERERAKLWNQLQPLPTEWLTFCPTPDQWSMLGVVDHLERVERALLNDARQQLTQPISVPDLRARVTFAVVWLVMRSRLKIKTPVGAENVGPQEHSLDLESLWSRWDVTRQELAERLCCINWFDGRLRTGVA